VEPSTGRYSSTTGEGGDTPVARALTGGGDSGTLEMAEDEHAYVAGSRVGATELQLPDLGRVGAPARSGDQRGRESVDISSCIPGYSDSGTKVPSSSSVSQSTSSMNLDGLGGNVPLGGKGGELS
jgi:hypothetical protein